MKYEFGRCTKRLSLCLRSSSSLRGCNKSTGILAILYEYLVLYSVFLFWVPADLFPPITQKESAGTQNKNTEYNTKYSYKIAKMPVDLLHPLKEDEERKHKLKRLVQRPNSYFMDVKCPGCFSITTVFSHAQTVVVCGSCSVMLCQPTGGKARLTEGCSFRKKVD
jgi:small subunit ribosomal protein S27e